MRKWHLVNLSLMLALSLAAAQTSAAVIPWTAQLSPDQEAHEVVGLSQTETGTASGTVDTNTGELTWDIAWSGLTGDAFGLHFHRGAPGVGGPITVDIFTGMAHDATDQHIGSAFISSDDVNELLAGLWYLNVHTAANPQGEIRGQVIAAVPQPATLLLLISGLVGFVLLRQWT
jgi:hypothetical protein